MSFTDRVSALLPFRKEEQKQEYFFALNIAIEKLTAALWVVEGKELKVLEVAAADYSSTEEIVSITDKLLDQVIGLKEIEPQKILFGVPNSWVVDDNLKEEYLRILRNLVKELELAPMAYVATAQSLIHFLEKQEGVPPTAILVGFEKRHLAVTVVRAGKLDGVKVVDRGQSCGADIEKTLLTFTDVETLPSKILIYGVDSAQLRSQLLSFSWMVNLSFLHFPKIDVLEDDIEIKSVCLAGGSEMDDNIKFARQYTRSPVKSTLIEIDKTDQDKEALDSVKSESPKASEPAIDQEKDNFGFIVGDISTQPSLEKETSLAEEPAVPERTSVSLPVTQEDFVEDETESLSMKHEQDLPQKSQARSGLNLSKFIPRGLTNLIILSGIVLSLALLSGAYIFLPKADVKIYVEPKVLEKDAQVIADPNQKSVSEEDKIIPGQIVEAEVSGTAKDTASGKKQIGDSAKGTIIIRNKTDSAVTLSKGTFLSSSSRLKFNLDSSVTIASKSGEEGTYGKATATVIAASIGADGNLSSGSDLTVVDYSTDKLTAKAEGNFSGGTSKDVTVVSDEDQKRLLASLASDLRKQAQQKLQDKYPDKKILQEALSENIGKKSYSKNINDQASEFSLTMTIKYKGTAFEDKDLKLIVSKLVDTQVPDGFQLDLAQTETQADVSKLEKDGKLIFLAKFKAKLIPKIDVDKIRNEIKFKSLTEVADILKGMDNVLGSEINLTPSLPTLLQRLPLLTKNIKIEVGLK